MAVVRVLTAQLVRSWVEGIRKSELRIPKSRPAPAPKMTVSRGLLVALLVIGVSIAELRSCSFLIGARLAQIDSKLNLVVGYRWCLRPAFARLRPQTDKAEPFKQRDVSRYIFVIAPGENSQLVNRRRTMTDNFCQEF
jgi:hypothetical protein